MSEVKFACPVCGQHITTDSSTSGSHIECPTCFRKMVVPQPVEGETKLLLSAAEVAANRRTFPIVPGRRKRRLPAWLSTAWSVVSVLLLLAAGAAAVYWYQARVRQTLPGSGVVSNLVPASKPAAPVVSAEWSLEADKAVFPHYGASGSIQGRPFTLDAATLRGSTLSLRQGRDGPPEIAITIVLLQEPGPGEIITAVPGAQVPTPRVVVRWRESRDQPRRHSYRSGYLLKLALDEIGDGKRPGRIYLALPDSTQSYIAGEFTAEVLPPWAPHSESARRQ